MFWKLAAPGETLVRLLIKGRRKEESCEKVYS